MRIEDNPTYYKELMNNAMKRDDIKLTENYQNVYNQAVSNFKELTGSEKQIAWAKKIREEVAHFLARSLCICKIDKLNGVTFYDTDEARKRYIAKCKPIINSTSASFIIDKRF